MRKWIIPAILLIILLSACTANPTATPIALTQSQQPTPTQAIVTSPPEEQQADVTPTKTVQQSVPYSTPPVFPPALGQPSYKTPDMAFVQNEWFTGAGNCAVCHQNMKSENGEDVSIDRFWRSTMMANSARDPYWFATVQREVATHPEISDVIEDKCATCHMPMAHFSASVSGSPTSVLEQGFSNPQNSLHDLAYDGVSCTVCHQILPDGLGEDSTFSGGFNIDDQKSMGERILFGPYEMDPALQEVMRSASGFVSQQGEHLQQSALCATCHTLFTPYLDPDTGEILGKFPEQTPFLEWAQSAYANTQSCQDCHMPVADSPVRISIAGGDPRSPFSQHAFVGGNGYMLTILKQFGEELGVSAGVEDFDATIGRVLSLMQTAAEVQITNPNITDNALTFDVQVINHSGHKFPTGYPSRRAWLFVQVIDGNGKILFSSGEYTPDGKINADDNDLDASKFEPHYEIIESPDQVQIYQSVLQDSNGELTTTLLHGASYSKDNRVLPEGLDRSTADTNIAVIGNAVDDGNFNAGSDIVTYRITLPAQYSMPIKVHVSLMFQSISYRWALNLIEGSTPGADVFGGYYTTIPNLPIEVSTFNLDINP